MKKQISAFIILMSLSSIAYTQVQTISTEAPAVDAAPKTEGLRVSVFKTSLSTEAKAYGGQMNSNSSSDKTAGALGLSFGYGNMPIQELGYSSNLSFLNLSADGYSAAALRLDANGTYSDYLFTRLINFKGGLNVSKFMSGEFLKDQEPSVGGQVSVGVNVYKDMAIDLGYTIMRQEKNINGVNVETQQSGLEIGLNSTF